MAVVAAARALPVMELRSGLKDVRRLVGHAIARTTEIVYRRELRPVITTGAEIMDDLFTAT